MEDRNKALERIVEIDESLSISNEVSFVREVALPKDFSYVKRFEKEISLPKPREQLLSTNLFEIITRRRSRREFNMFKPVDLDTLSTILFASVGKTASVDGIYGLLDYPLRASPSAGGLHCADLYVAALRVEDLPPGIYYYNYVNHSLGVICEACVPHDVTESVYQPMLRVAPVYFIYVAVFRRGAWKYREIYYKYCLVDVGAAAENAHLAAEAAGLASVFIAGFDRHKVSKSLILDRYEAPVLLLALGYPKQLG